jgi:hypothetical protein
VTSLVLAPVEHAITVQLPWTLAITAGVKLVENRPKMTSHRGLVGIHAGVEWSEGGATDPRILQWWHGTEYGRLERAEFAYAFRHVLAVAEIVDCHRARPSGWDSVSCCTSKWAAVNGGAVHVVLANVVALDTPVRVVGKVQVPFRMTPAEAASVTASYHDTLMARFRAQLAGGGPGVG